MFSACGWKITSDDPTAVTGKSRFAVPGYRHRLHQSDDGSTRRWRDHLYRDCSPVASEKQINNFLQKASSGAFDRMNSNYPAYPDLFWRPPETFEISPVLLGRYAISL